MQVYGILTQWKKNTPASTSYPSYEAIATLPDDAPAVLKEWKAAMFAAAEIVQASSAFIFHNRVDLDNGTALTLAYYTTKADYDAMVDANAAAFVRLFDARDALAAYLNVTVEEKKGTFDISSVDYANAASIITFMDSLPA